jgi:hypothetical protein
MISPTAITHSGQPVVTLTGSADALPMEGSVNLASAGVDALTLATPTAGAIANGGDDGRILTVIDTGGHAHTITTAANKINGNKHVATFGGTAYQFAQLIAMNGVWVELASSGITLS